jgi:hypothetical protein
MDDAIPGKRSASFDATPVPPPKKAMMQVRSDNLWWARALSLFS